MSKRISDLRYIARLEEQIHKDAQRFDRLAQATAHAEMHAMYTRWRDDALAALEAPCTSTP